MTAIPFSESGMRPVSTALLSLALTGLSACFEPAGGRYIVAANAAGLVVVEQVVVNGASASARTTMVTPEDKPLPLTGKAPIVRVQYFHEFDCSGRQMASRGQRFVLQDGEILDLPARQLKWKKPDRQLEGDILAVVCDPAIAREKSTRNSFGAVTRRYQRLLREQAGQAS